jgi:hypothetical protein
MITPTVTELVRNGNRVDSASSWRATAPLPANGCSTDRRPTPPCASPTPTPLGGRGRGYLIDRVERTAARPCPRSPTRAATRTDPGEIAIRC